MNHNRNKQHVFKDVSSYEHDHNNSSISNKPVPTTPEAFSLQTSNGASLKGCLMKTFTFNLLLTALLSRILFSRFLLVQAFERCQNLAMFALPIGPP